MSSGACGACPTPWTLLCVAWGLQRRLASCRYLERLLTHSALLGSPSSYSPSRPLGSQMPNSASPLAGACCFWVRAAGRTSGMSHQRVSMWPSQSPRLKLGDRVRLPQASDSTSVKYLRAPPICQHALLPHPKHTCRLAKPHGGFSGGVAEPEELVSPNCKHEVPGSFQLSLQCSTKCTEAWGQAGDRGGFVSPLQTLGKPVPSFPRRAPHPWKRLLEGAGSPLATVR